MFPNTMAACRLNEVRDLMEEFDTDIIVVQRINSFAGVEFPLQWEELVDSHHLRDYNALIFNPAYNKLDGLNKLDRHPSEWFNGTAFNGKWPADYMLRLRKYGNSMPSIDDYAAIHHIFLLAYTVMKTAMPLVRPERQSIHLYPGGGFFVGDNKSLDVDAQVLLFPTQAYMLPYLNQHAPSNPVVEVFGGVFLPRGARKELKAAKSPSQPLGVAFSSLGDVREKGADLYVALAERFKERYPGDPAGFYGVGNVPASPTVIHVPTMPQANLTAFYRSKIDVYFNLDRTDRRNGWPLGIEAVLEGAVLFTTEDKGMNAANNFKFREGLTIVTEGNEAPALALLHDYVQDRRKLALHSAAIQQRSVDLFGYAQQTGRIARAIKKRIREHMVVAAGDLCSTCLPELASRVSAFLHCCWSSGRQTARRHIFDNDGTSCQAGTCANADIVRHFAADS